MNLQIISTLSLILLVKHFIRMKKRPLALKKEVGHHQAQRAGGKRDGLPGTIQDSGLIGLFDK